MIYYYSYRSTDRIIQMVYTILEVVFGFVISRDEVLQLLDLELEGEDDGPIGYNIEKLFDDLGYDKDLYLYQFPCCSESEGKVFMIHRKLHKYWRKPIR